MASSTQLAPFAYDMVMPKLRASAAAAAKTCTGGPDGTSCSIHWTAQKYTGGPLDVGLQLAALEVVQSTLIPKVEDPVSQDNGGISQGNPAGGVEEDPPQPSIKTRHITIGDRVGAAIVTIVTTAGILWALKWVVHDPHE